jgi:hypothetical protein
MALTHVQVGDGYREMLRPNPATILPRGALHATLATSKHLTACLHYSVARVAGVLAQTGRSRRAGPLNCDCHWCCN